MARYKQLGHQMICTCGCGQVLLECNHVGCTVSTQEEAELRTALDRGDSNNLILQNFVQKYGPTVLAAPTGKRIQSGGLDYAGMVFLLATLDAVLRDSQMEVADGCHAARNGRRSRTRMRF